MKEKSMTGYNRTPYEKTPYCSFSQNLCRLSPFVQLVGKPPKKRKSKESIVNEKTVQDKRRFTHELCERNGRCGCWLNDAKIYDKTNQNATGQNNIKTIGFVFKSTPMPIMAETKTSKRRYYYEKNNKNSAY